MRRKLRRRESVDVPFDHPAFGMLVSDIVAYKNYPGAPSARVVFPEDGRIIAYGDAEAVEAAFKRFTGGAPVETVRIKNPTREQIAAALSQTARPVLPGAKQS